MRGVSNQNIPVNSWINARKNVSKCQYWWLYAVASTKPHQTGFWSVRGDYRCSLLSHYVNIIVFRLANTTHLPATAILRGAMNLRAVITHVRVRDLWCWLAKLRWRCGTVRFLLTGCLIWLHSMCWLYGQMCLHGLPRSVQVCATRFILHNNSCQLGRGAAV